MAALTSGGLLACWRISLGTTLHLISCLLLLKDHSINQEPVCLFLTASCGWAPKDADPLGLFGLGPCPNPLLLPPAVTLRLLCGLLPAGPTKRAACAVGGGSRDQQGGSMPPHNHEQRGPQSSKRLEHRSSTDSSLGEVLLVSRCPEEETRVRTFSCFPRVLH